MDEAACPVSATLHPPALLLMIGALLGAVAGATNDRTVFSSVNCKSIESAIGTPEMTFDLTMTGDGWQWVLTAGERTYRHTERWADSFAE